MQILLANAKIMNDCSEVQPQTAPKFQSIANELAAEMAKKGWWIEDASSMGKIMSWSYGALYSDQQDY